jgi:hypothetical protein
MLLLLVLKNGTIKGVAGVNSKQKNTLEKIFKSPVPENIKWDDIISLLRALDAEISEGNGSRVRIVLNGAKATFQRPHPSPDTDRGAVKSTRRFLEAAGVSYEKQSA